MKKVQFTCNCIPKGKARPRVTTVNGHSRAYTPKATVDFEKEIAAAYKKIYPEFMFSADDNLKAEIIIKMPLLKSFTKTQKQQALSGELLPAKKPDIDNILKSIFDSLNNICYPGDNQIIYVTAKKIYSDEPGLKITVEKI